MRRREWYLPVRFAFLLAFAMVASAEACGNSEDEQSRGSARKVPDLYVHSASTTEPADSSDGVASAAHRDKSVGAFDAPPEPASASDPEAVVGATSVDVVDFNTDALYQLRGRTGTFAFNVPLSDEQQSVAYLSFDGSRSGGLSDFSGSFRKANVSSSISLSLFESQVRGTFQIGDTLFQILPYRDSTGAATSRHLLIRQTPDSLPTELPPLRPPAPPRPSGDVPDDADIAVTPPEKPCARATVHVLIAFTSGAAAGIDDRGLQALAESGILQANEALRASMVPHQLRLAGVRRLSARDMGETGDLRKDLPAALSSARVRALRRQTRADLVSVWTQRRSGDACGLGYVTMNMTTDAPYGINVVPTDCAIALGQYSFAHEIGHNFGMQHDRATAVQDRGIFTYSHGYYPSNYAFRDLMAYPCPVRCSRVLLYSNPAVQYRGTAAGVDAKLPDAADNALTARQTLCRLEQWDSAPGS